jgi:hypothetical protein
MTFGIRITNPSNVLIIDSEVMGKRYMGQATRYGTATQPYAFRVTTTSSSDVPIPFLRLDENSRFAVISVVLISGSTFEITVHGRNYNEGSDYGRGAIPALPQVHYYANMVNSGELFGLRLTSSSNECTFDSAYQPLMPVANYNYTQVQFSGKTEADPIVRGDYMAVSLPSTFLISGSCNGVLSMNRGSGVSLYRFGWRYSGGYLYRERLWMEDHGPSVSGTPSNEGGMLGDASPIFTNPF